MNQCRICGGELKPWRVVNQYDLLRCSSCGAGCVFPYLKEKDAAQLYVENQRSELEYYSTTILEDTKTFDKRLEFMERFVPDSKRSVLDVGCSIGTFLRVAKDRGWFLPVGFDLNKRALDLIKDDLIRAYDFMPNIEFGAVHASDVLEHVVDPKRFLARLRYQLCDGGFLFVTTPNASSLFAKMLGRKWHAIKPPEHLFYFNEEGIAALAKNTGFRVVEVRRSRRYRRVGVLLERLAAISFLGRFLKILTPRSIKNVVVPFSLGDEMLVVLQKC